MRVVPLAISARTFGIYFPHSRSHCPIFLVNSIKVMAMIKEFWLFYFQVRLMGCQDLLEDVPGRSRRDKDNSSSPSDLRLFGGLKGVTGRSSSKSYSVKDETSRK